MSAVVDHVIAAIGPVSEACAHAARERLAPARMPTLARLAGALAAAQHTPAPRTERRVLVIAAGDHGCGDPGISLGADHPTVVAAREIAGGRGAACGLARRTSPPTQIVLVDAGTREPAHMPSVAIRLGRGPSRDLLREPALTVDEALAGLEAGIALSVSLAEAGLDVLALGALGLGSEVASAALVGAVHRGPVELGERDEAAERALAYGTTLRGASGIELLAHAGGGDTAVLAGLVLGAASIAVPVILDGYATGAAALVAAALAPDVTGYLIAGHRGRFTMPAIVEHLGISAVYDGGIGLGDGAGAAMILHLVDQLAAVTEQG